MRLLMRERGTSSYITHSGLELKYFIASPTVLLALRITGAAPHQEEDHEKEEEEEDEEQNEY